MTIAFSVLMCLAGLFAAFWLWSLIADFSTDKLLSYEAWSDRFFNLAARLLDRDDLPEEWIDTLAQLNQWIDDRSMSLSLLRLYDAKKKGKLDGAEASLAEPVERFLEKHPELGGDYISAMRAAFLAMTFMAPFKLGNDIRAHMAEDWERQRSKGNRSVTKEIEAIKQASHLKLVHSTA